MSSHALTTLKVLEQCEISPPPHSNPPTSLIPLTFLDLPWLFFSQSQPLFFYDFPFPISHFTNSTLPNLKHSLSLTLQHYFTFAANLVVSSSDDDEEDRDKPHIVCAEEEDSVSLVVAESTGDFDQFCSDGARDANWFHPLVPRLASKSSGEIPLLAIQITVFPSAGISIGLAYHNVLADERTFNNFIKTWAAYCSSGSSSSLESLPIYDRGVIVDENGLEEIFLREWRERKVSQEEVVIGIDDKKVETSGDMVRATFLVDPTAMEKIRGFIIATCEKQNQPLPVHLSPYVLACAFLWVCLLKTHQIITNESQYHASPDRACFGFIAGGITRMPFPVPTNYLGNCVGFGRAIAEREELLGEDGIVVAARALGSTIKKLDKEVLSGVEKWVSDWDEINGSDLHVVVTWSPKLDLYETDFGWGEPRKIEEISIDRSKAISVIESRDVGGGMEMGLALPKTKMDAFTMFFTNGLNLMALS